MCRSVIDESSTDVGIVTRRNNDAWTHHAATLDLDAHDEHYKRHDEQTTSDEYTSRDSRMVETSVRNGNE